MISERVIGEPIGWPDPPIVAVLAVVLYAIAANVCFTGGWISELVVRRVWPEEADRFGGLAFTLGLAFAVLVTTLPVPLIAGIAVLFWLWT